MNNGRILVATVNDVPILKFIGDVRVLMSSALDNYFNSLYNRAILDRMMVDMTETQGIDSTALGLLAKMSIQLRNRFNVRPTIISTNPDITRILKSMSIDLICEIIETVDKQETCFDELNPLQETEDSVRQKVIEAHQTLMNLSEDNRAEFQDLVSALKSDH
ncbi:MAG: anti-sigma factor antagonist [Gammaproteobacteria bacterium]|nr:anti-sigma factor antagonist [Gammaproteobacteria bacterium]